jgi:hypothetical protein
VLLQIENMLDMMTLTSGLAISGYRRVSSGQASSCHSEPKGWGPLRLYHVNLCITIVMQAGQRTVISAFADLTTGSVISEHELQQPAPDTPAEACQQQ